MSDHSLHAPLAPSASERWINCPGSYKLSKGFPDTSSVDARLGTFAHTIAERCLREGIAAKNLIGTTDGEFSCDAEMAEHLQFYLDEVRQTAAGAVIGVEWRVRVTDMIYGTADAVIFKNDTLHVFDLKYGAGIYVEVEGNSQVSIYALGALLDERSKRDGKTPERVVLHVVQPRHAKGEPHRRSEVWAKDLKKWARDVLSMAQAAALEGAAFKAGSWCRWCPAKSMCPTLRDNAIATARSVFADPVAMTTTARVPSATELTPEQVAQALKAFDVVDQWMSAVREHAYNLANSGTKVPGYKLVEKTGHRKWRDENAAAEELELFLPSGASMFTKPEVISPAQAEKLLKGPDKKRVEALTLKPTIGTVLVSDSDPRDAKNPADVFSVLEGG